MPQFSKESILRLATCDPRIQMVLKEAIRMVDFTVICGHRTSIDQEALFLEGKTKKKYGESKHNEYPSLAVDIAPWPIDVEYMPSYYYLAGVIKCTGFRLGIHLKWGGDVDLDVDYNSKDNKLLRLGHFEVEEYE